MVYYELLKPGETINTKRYQQLIDLNCSLLKNRPEYQKRQHKVIFLHDNALSYSAKQFGTRWKHSTGKFYLTRLRLTHQTWLPDYHLFASMGHTLAEQRFGSYEDVKKMAR